MVVIDLYQNKYYIYTYPIKLPKLEPLLKKGLINSIYENKFIVCNNKTSFVWVYYKKNIKRYKNVSK